MKRNKQNILLIFSLTLCGLMLLLSGCGEIGPTPKESPTLPLVSNTPFEPSTPTPVPSATSNPSKNKPSPTPIFPEQVGTPPNTISMNYVFDKERALVYAFGGSSDKECDPCDKTWVWDFKEWKYIKTAVHPKARSGASFAYDPVRKVSVLFGGVGEHGKFLNDTWLWNGTDWVEQDPELSPLPRSAANMVFDEAHQVMFLFGGTWNEDNSRHTTILNDVWIWDGNLWTEINPTTEDSHQSVLAYDIDNQQIIRMSYSKMWTWDWAENAWADTNLENIPYFIQGAMAYDSSNHQLMVICEDLSLSGYHPAAWLWNGEVLRQAPLPWGLVGVASASLIDDPIHQGLLLFGYRIIYPKQPFTNSAWFWNGTDWTTIY